jgi:type II secretory pathway component PulF
MQNGKTLASGVELLSKTAHSKQERKAYEKINKDIKEGYSFSDSLLKHKIGSLDVIQFITMADKGVNFKNTLSKIVEYLQTKDEFQRETNDKTSLPIIYFTLASFVVLGIKFIAVPMQIERSLKYSKEIIELISAHLQMAQLLTDILFIILVVFSSYFIILLSALFSHSRLIQGVAKQFALMLPLSSIIVLKFEKFLLFSMLGEMLKSGISFKNSMTCAMQTTTLNRFKKAIKETLESVKYEGKLVFHSHLYDGVEKELLRGVGSSEQTGSIMLEISSRAKTDAMKLSTKFFRLITFISIFMMAFAVFIEFFTVVLTQILIQKGMIDATRGLGTF